MMTKRCLVCSRDFHFDQSRCHNCDLPLYDTTSPVPIQRLELQQIQQILYRRYICIQRSLDPCKLIKYDSIPNFSWSWSLGLAGLVINFFQSIFTATQSYNKRGNIEWLNTK